MEREEKWIEIFQGDEFRAKIEQNILPEDGERSNRIVFNKDLYWQADQIVTEISELAKQVREESKVRKNCINVPRMASNILLVNGDRGDGKTSFLLSFANYLQSKKCGYKYLVMEPMDPSNFGQNESLVKIVVSSLFAYVEEHYKEKICCDSKGGESYHKLKIEIVALFQKIYSSISLLNNVKDTEREIGDDLEMMADIGNSLKLREHIGDLIQYYLKLTDCTDDGFLVIPVDDLDLCKGNVFSLCEDIRKYFSIPQVIILLAADYSQLHYAIRNAYITEYAALLEELADEDKKGFSNRLAARYLEKVFPPERHIHLLTIRQLLNENYRNLKIFYSKEREKENLLSDINCVDLQEQMIKCIYECTGILLIPQEGKVHPLLPYRMRELTHFLKMLADMKQGEMIQVDGEKNELQGSGVYLRRRKNLRKLKDYYLTFWCKNNLYPAEQNVIYDIEEENGELNYAVQRVRDFLESVGESFLGGYGPGTPLYQLIYELVEERMRNNSNLREGIKFYYTLFLQEKYLTYMIDTYRMQQTNSEDIDEITKQTLSFFETKETTAAINIYRYSYDVERFRMLTGRNSELSQSARALYSNQEYDEVSSRNFYYRDEDVIEKDEDIFDVRLLFWNYWEKSIKSLDTGAIRLRRLQSDDYDMSEPVQYWMARTIVTNCELLCLMQKGTRKHTSTEWLVGDLLDAFIPIKDAFDKCRFINPHISSVLIELFLSEQVSEDLCARIFLSNKKNADWYYKRYVIQSKDYRKKIKEWCKRIENSKNTDNVLKVVEPPERVKYLRLRAKIIAPLNDCFEGVAIAEWMKKDEEIERIVQEIWDIYSKPDDIEEAESDISSEQENKLNAKLEDMKKILG